MNELIVVISAAFLNFVFGLVWHVFVRKQKEISTDEISSSLKKKDPSRHLLNLIGSLWVSYGMFVMIKHLKPNGNIEILTIALGTWLLIYVGLSAKHLNLNHIGLRKLVIDYTQDLIGLMIITFIIGGSLSV